MSDSKNESQHDSIQAKRVRSFVRNSGFTALSDLLDRIANIFIIIYLSRGLGAADVGIYTLAISYFFIGSRFAFWGLDHLLIRDVAQKPEMTNKYVVNFVVLRVVLSLIAICLLSTLIYILPYASDVRIVILIFLWGILGENVINIAESVFISAERMEFLSVLALFSGFVKLIGCIVVIGLGGTLLHLAIVILITSLLSLALSLFLLRRFLGSDRLRVDFVFCQEQLAIAKPFIIVAVTFILNNRLDTILLSLFISQAEIGFYGAAVTIVTALTMIPQSIATAIFPTFARISNRANLQEQERDPAAPSLLNPSMEVQQKFRQVFKYMLIIVVPLSLGLMAVADRAVDFVFTSTFLKTVPVLQVLALFIFFNGLNVLNSRLLIIANRQDLIARFQAITLVMNILLIVLLVPPFGIVGAAIAKLSTMAGLYFYMRRAVYRTVSAFPIADLLKHPVLAGIGMVLIVWLLRATPLWLQISAGALTYMSLIIIMGTITPDERTLWRNVLYHSRS